jgi:hypothetical protein
MSFPFDIDWQIGYFNSTSISWKGPGDSAWSISVVNPAGAFPSSYPIYLSADHNKPAEAGNSLIFFVLFGGVTGIEPLTS